MYTHCICLSLLRYDSPLYHLPALPILPVNSFIFTVLPVNLKHGKSSTLVPSIIHVAKIIDLQTDKKRAGKLNSLRLFECPPFRSKLGHEIRDW